MGSDNIHNTKETKMKLDYLKELLTDRNILANDPRTYLHVGKILENEILRIRSSLFSMCGINPISDNELPEPEGMKVNLQTKVYMPTDGVNSFNFVGRILGPDGSTVKCLQQCLGVKIMVRGRGSMRDRKKEEAYIGKPNWEHLSDKLHVVLTVEDYENRAKARLEKASEYITTFLKESMKASDKDDRVKQMQLMELSFRRAPYSTWCHNFNNYLDVNFHPKSGALFSTATANFLNFGYAYQSPAPLISTLPHPTVGLYEHQHASHHVHAQTLQQGYPNTMESQQQQQQQQHHPHPTTQNMGTPLAGYPTGFGNNLSTPTLLFGHSPNSAAGYPGQFNLTSHAPSAASGLAVAPLSYWTAQGLSPFSANEYAYPLSTPINGGHQMTRSMNAEYCSSALVQHSDASSTSAQNECCNYSASITSAEESMHTYNRSSEACPVNGFRDLSLGEDNTLLAFSESANNTVILPYGKLQNSIAPVSTDQNKLKTTIFHNMRHDASMTRTPGNKRYSQKHADLTVNQKPPCAPKSQNGPTPVTDGTRSAVVSVRVPASTSACSRQYMCSTSSGEDSLTGNTEDFVPNSKPVHSNNELSNTSTDTEEDWPKLRSSGEKEMKETNNLILSPVNRNKTDVNCSTAASEIVNA